MSGVRFTELGSIKSSFDELVKPATPPGAWLLLGYADDNTITFQGTGAGGVDELREHLKDDQIQYAVVRISDVKAGAAVTRDVFLGWFGPSFSKIKTAKRKPHLADVRRLLSPNHGQLEVLGKRELTEDVVRDRSGPGTGSHVIE